MKPEEAQQLIQSINTALAQVVQGTRLLLAHYTDVHITNTEVQRANKTLTDQVLVLLKRVEEVEGTEEFKAARLKAHEEAAKKHRSLLAVSEAEIAKLKN